MQLGLRNLLGSVSLQGGALLKLFELLFDSNSEQLYDSNGEVLKAKTE